MSRASRLIGIVAMFGVLTGCSGGTNPNAPATVTGKVTYKGAPVTGGMLFFHAADSSMSPVVIDNDGNYQARDMPIGEMTVTVDTEMNNPKRHAQQYPGSGGKKVQEYKPPEGVTGAAATYVNIPSKYTDKTKSDLKVTVAAGKQAKDFELKD